MTDFGISVESYIEGLKFEALTPRDDAHKKELAAALKAAEGVETPAPVAD